MGLWKEMGLGREKGLGRRFRGGRWDWGWIWVWGGWVGEGDALGRETDWGGRGLEKGKGLGEDF